VLEELVVLGGDDRVLHVLRDLRQRDVAAELVVHHRDQRLAVVRVDAGDLWRPLVLELARQIVERLGPGLGGQTGHRDGRECGGSHHHTGEQAADQQRRAVRQEVVVTLAHTVHAKQGT
jgi:hypothetical protein